MDSIPGVPGAGVFGALPVRGGMDRLGRCLLHHGHDNDGEGGGLRGCDGKLLWCRV